VDVMSVGAVLIGVICDFLQLLRNNVAVVPWDRARLPLFKILATSLYVVRLINLIEWTPFITSRTIQSYLLSLSVMCLQAKSTARCDNTYVWQLSDWLVHRSCLCIYFLCSLFYNTVSNSDCAALNDGLVVNNELEGMWKEAVVD
jgi:hypothetical protein